MAAIGRRRLHVVIRSEFLPPSEGRQQMFRMRALTRWILILGIAAIAFLIVKRTLLKSYSGSEPIEISTTRAPATFERAFPNLTFERPIYLTFPPDGSNRVAVVSQFGRVFIFRNDQR